MTVEAATISGAASLVEAALAEDVGDGDRTTLWTVDPERRARARIVAKADVVVAGLDVAELVFRTIDHGLSCVRLVADGDRVAPSGEVLAVSGRAASILSAERTALNFLGRLSGVATLTRRFVDAVEGTGARILDTRKTTPAWRVLEKAAVRAGGGVNHRMGLHDMVLVKENHIAAAGGLREAIDRVRRANREGLEVEVEVRALEELEVLREEGVDRILLDNMAPDLLREAVERVGAWPAPRPELEASGNVALDRVRDVAETGVAWISVGALTHSAPTADLSLLVEPWPGGEPVR